MVKVFVNGIGAKSGGGRSILTNFLKVAREADDEFDYVVAVPDAHSYSSLANDRVELIPLSRWSATVLVPLASTAVLPRLARRLRCELVFNLADVPLRTALPQVFLFDWPYAAFPESPAWRLSTLRDRAVRYAKLLFFRWLLPNVDLILAQNDVIAQRLHRIYRCHNVSIVPNAVSLDNLSGGTERNFNLGSGYKLLCLSRYYSHKNIEVFLSLAERIRDGGEPMKIVTTVSLDDGEGAARFLSEIVWRRLGDIIVNLGTVPMEQVPGLYRQTDALLLPTLLESFSGTYIEAMFHRKPILTSRLPFAEAVCGGAAYYFDPLDVDEILECVRQVQSDPVERDRRLDDASAMLAHMPSWHDTYRAYTNTFEIAVGR